MTSRRPPPSGPLGGYGVDLPTGVLPPVDPGALKTDPSAVASLACGVLALILGNCCFPLFGVVFGLAGLALGIVSLVRLAAPGSRYSGRGLAVAGIVVSLLGQVAGAALLYFYVASLP